MDSQNRFLFVLVGVVLMISLSTIFLIDRDVWFDESYTELTVQKMHVEKIDFSQFDVHPPVYYWTAYGWSFLNPGFPLHVWLRILSAVFACVFIGCASVFVFRVFGFDAETMLAMILMAVSTTIVLYATEARMYMMVMAISAALMVAVTDEVRAAWKEIAVIGLVILLPFTHYLSVVCLGFVVLVAVVWRGWDAAKDLVWKIMFVGSVATLAAFFAYAQPQMARMESMWFQSPTMVSGISGVFYAFQTTADVVPNLPTGVPLSVSGLLLLFFVVGLVLAGYEVLKGGKTGTRSERVAVVMLSAAVVPFFGVLLGKFLALYHHRFFLVATWLVVPVVYVSLLRRYTWKAALPLIIVSAVSLGLFLSSSDAREMHDMYRSIPCEEGSTFVHTTAFTYHTFEVYNREECGKIKNMLSSSITPRQGHSAGYDVLSSDVFFWNSTYPAESFYFIREYGERDRLGVNNESVVVQSFPHAAVAYRRAR